MNARISASWPRLTPRLRVTSRAVRASSEARPGKNTVLPLPEIVSLPVTMSMPVLSSLPVVAQLPLPVLDIAAVGDQGGTSGKWEERGGRGGASSMAERGGVYLFHA